MELDDLLPRNQKPKPRDLSALSVGELEEYIAAMEAEIARVRETIRAKRDVRGAAEAFFKR
ncbi:DUF1192 domain-containing protein [Aerophototrophica crusticola]|uniref:DUF1192 domain-containing protein n=1 Tax=Aerophototrophica crusticola TaxID=1709002 RepID=A0A858RBP3_9PROT|nr:DUF1192 domain-containing protein [Rhodospirillaceae bacterium B3]